MTEKRPPRILAIAGSDSSGGAGIQADIKTITMLGGYAMTAITAVTAQNTEGVQAVEVHSGEFVLEQFVSCVEDIGVDAIKIGMLANDDIIRHVSAGLVASPRIRARSRIGYIKGKASPAAERFPIVIDPVMVATSGARLISDDAIEALKSRLLPLATLITPNLPELEVLTGLACNTEQQITEAAHKLAEGTGCAVLAKGGHATGDRVVDLLVDPFGRDASFDDPRIDTRHTHGTGCTLSSAIATLLGHGQPLEHSVRLGRRFVREAIFHAPGFGSGSGPLGHQAVRSGGTRQTYGSMA